MQPDRPLVAAPAGVDYSAIIVRDGAVSAEWDADRPRPLASCVKIVHLQATLDAFSAGAEQPGRAVPVSRWRAYHLPGSDAGAHDDALRDAGLVKLNGGIADRADVPLSRLLVSMLHHSDNAAADLVSELLGGDWMHSFVSTPPPLILEMMLRLLDRTPRGASPQSARLAARYLAEPGSRAGIARLFRTALRSLRFEEHAAWGAASYRATARELMNIALLRPMEPWLTTHLGPGGVAVSAKFGMLPGVVAGVLTSLPAGGRVTAIILCEGLDHDAYEDERRTARLRRTLIELAASPPGELESLIIPAASRGSA